MEKTCPHCGAALPREASFCPVCAKSIGEKRRIRSRPRLPLRWINRLMLLALCVGLVFLLPRLNLPGSEPQKGETQEQQPAKPNADNSSEAGAGGVMPTVSPLPEIAPLQIKIVGKPVSVAYFTNDHNRRNGVDYTCDKVNYTSLSAARASDGGVIFTAFFTLTQDMQVIAARDNWNTGTSRLSQEDTSYTFHLPREQLVKNSSQRLWIRIACSETGDPNGDAVRCTMLIEPYLLSSMAEGADTLQPLQATAGAAVPDPLPLTNTGVTAVGEGQDLRFHVHYSPNGVPCSTAEVWSISAAKASDGGAFFYLDVSLQESMIFQVFGRVNGLFTQLDNLPVGRNLYTFHLTARQLEAVEDDLNFNLRYDSQNSTDADGAEGLNVWVPGEELRNFLQSN